ncbi:MAG: hypothetical protein HQL70_11210 [Magnetococcales bacterium]|nr:hypothetical protein [Magnetococcales bacterium]
MPVTKELIGKDAIVGLTGKSFTLDGVGTGNPVTLTPSPGPDGVVAGHKIILSKGTAIEGIAKTGAATAKAPVVQGVAGNTMAAQGVAGNTMAAQGVAGKTAVAPTLVQIEGAGKVVGLGKGSTTISTLEVTGTLQKGAAGGSKVMLTGGEMKVVQGAGATAAKAAPGAALANGGNGGVVITKGAGGGNIATVKSVAGANANGGLPTIATKAATVSKVPAAAGGTIWTGKGLSLGLGLGLGAWGPVILATAIATGGYVYYKKRQAKKLWPF